MKTPLLALALLFAACATQTDIRPQTQEVQQQTLAMEPSPGRVVLDLDGNPVIEEMVLMDGDRPVVVTGRARDGMAFLVFVEDSRGCPGWLICESVRVTDGKGRALSVMGSVPSIRPPLQGMVIFFDTPQQLNDSETLTVQLCKSRIHLDAAATQTVKDMVGQMKQGSSTQKI